GHRAARALPEPLLAGETVKHPLRGRVLPTEPEAFARLLVLEVRGRRGPLVVAVVVVVARVGEIVLPGPILLRPATTGHGARLDPARRGRRGRRRRSRSRRAGRRGRGAGPLIGDSHR